MHRCFSLRLLSAVGGLTLATLPTAQAAPDQTQGVAIMSAVVGQSGGFSDGAGVVSAERADEGIYRVTFNRDPQGCVPVASPLGGGAGLASVILPVPGEVTVRTFDLSGNPQDGAFTLLLFCAR